MSQLAVLVQMNDMTYLTVFLKEQNLFLIYSFRYKRAHSRHDAFFIVLLINVIIHLAFVQVFFQIPYKSSEKDSLAIHIC